MKKTISYEEMKRLYEEWMVNPVGTQQDFFRKYGWSRTRFINETYDRDNGA